MLWKCPKDEAIRLSPLVLAYVGDAVFELYVRCRLATAEAKVGRIHSRAIGLVSAKAMAAYYKVLDPLLTDEERGILHRGRNVKSRHSRSAGVGQYRRSTGFEALVGYLFLSGQEERLEQLFVHVLGADDE